MKLIQIFQIIVILNAVKSYVMDPICSACLSIDQSLVSQTYRQQFGMNLTQFQLPGFSLSTIIVDFRHLNYIPTQNNASIFQLMFEITDISTQQKSVILVNDTIIGTNEYQLQSTAQLKFVIFFFVHEEFNAFQYLLRDSVSLNLSYSNNRIPSEDSSYVFFVSSTDNINLPSNKPDLTNMQSYYLQNQRNTSSFQSSVVYSESTMYWSTDSQFAVPYFPYFSNCNGEGNMMQIMDMLQNTSDCNLIPINQTGWISEFSFGSSARADKCSIKRKCTIESREDTTEYPDWLTLPVGLNLFSISQQKIHWRDFSYNMDFESQQLVMCKINNSKGSNNSNTYPLKVKLSMGYYQVSQTEKKIISCLVEYDLYVASTTNFTYQLQVASYPLNHTYIMLNFGFKWYVYMIVFVIIGVVGNVENLLLWIYHYFVAQERKEIKLMIYLRIIWEIIKGTVMALVLQMLIIFIVCLVMNGKIFTTTFYQKGTLGSTTPRVFFDYILQQPTKNYDSDEMQNLRAGRMGVAFIAIGIMIILLKCKYFIGKEKTTEEYKDFSILGRMFKPLSWNRGKFLFGTFFYIILMYFFIYFAYSTLYSTNIWTFIVVMKVLQVIMEQITNRMYGDILPALPLKIVTDITAYLNTISAADLYDFLFGSLIDVAITMIQKIYIFQIQNMIVDKIVEKSEDFNRFYTNLMNQQDGDEEGMNNFAGHEYLINSEEDADNQQVFIRREAQQVEFFQQQIKEVYLWTKADQQARVLIQCKDTESERKLKRKYFQSLQKDYRYRRQLLFKNDKEINQQEQKQNRANQNNDQQNLQGGEMAQAAREEAMEKESAIFQLLLDHMAMIYTFLVNPFVVFIFWLTYDQSALLTKYGIVYNTVVLYILSALVIGVFSVINIIMIFHILQSYMGLSFEEQITDILSRFNLRKTFWKADQQELNQNLKPQILGADHYCLSSQLFFILTVYVGGMILVILGLAIVFQAEYNFFDDIATIPIIVFWTMFLFIFILIVEKVAMFLNIWDYKIYEQNKEMDSKGQNGNMYAIMDQKQLLRQLQENSDFKTENIIFAPLEELPKFKKLFNINKKGNQQPQKEQEEGQKQENQQKGLQKSNYVENGKNKDSYKKNKWLLQQQTLKLQNQEQRQRILLAQKRLQTICRKLQPLFSKQSFKLQYSKKNNQFIKENIEKILPLVEYLPDLQQFKNLIPTSSSTSAIHSHHNISAQHKSADHKRQQNSAINKNMDPVIAEIILEWLRATEKSRTRKIANGLEEESKLKKCSFCYETWGLYYGHGGMCLQCSMRLANKKKEAAQFARQTELKIRNRTRMSTLVKERGRKRKNTKKNENLNVIQEQEYIDDQNNSEDDDEDNSQQEIVKGQRKEHRD